MPNATSRPTPQSRISQGKVPCYRGQTEEFFVSASRQLPAIWLLGTVDGLLPPFIEQRIACHHRFSEGTSRHEIVAP